MASLVNWRSTTQRRYAGTGNVLKIQSLLHACSEHVDSEAEGYKDSDTDFQAFATIGVALIAMVRGVVHVTQMCAMQGHVRAHTRTHARL